MKIFKKFISFEGIDFCGKTTQIELLLKRLESYHLPVHLVREPGGTTISERIRQILLDKSLKEMNPRTEILLYSAARTQLVHQTILPLLEKGYYVVADRFVDSTTAYQGVGRNLNPTVVDILNEFATSGLKPYKTFLIDISPEEAERRRKSLRERRDRLESEGLTFYKTIRQGFMEIASREPERFVIIPGERGIEEVAEEIWKRVVQFWNISS